MATMRERRRNCYEAFEIPAQGPEFLGVLTIPSSLPQNSGTGTPKEKPSHHRPILDLECSRIDWLDRTNEHFVLDA